MSAIAATVISFLQAILFCILGPCTLFFGPLVGKSVTVIQSVLASGYLGVLNSIMAVRSDTVFTVLEGTFFMLSGALTMSFATLKSETGNQVMKGMATGYLVAEPILTIIAQMLYRDVAGCTRLGEPNIEFPMGQPMGPEGDEGECTPEGKKFLMCFYIIKALKWIFTLGSGQLGVIFADFFLVFSSAMTGAAMTVMAFRDLILAIAIEAGGKEMGERLMGPITAMSMVLMYGLAGFGFLVMVGMAKRFKEVKKRKKKRKEEAKLAAMKAEAMGETPEEEDSGKKKGKVTPIPVGSKTDPDGPLPEPQGPAKYFLKYFSCLFVLLKLMEKMETWIENKIDAPPKGEKMKKKMKKPGVKAALMFAMSNIKNKKIVPGKADMAEKAKAKADEAKEKAKEKAQARKADPADDNPADETSEADAEAAKEEKKKKKEEKKAKKEEKKNKKKEKEEAESAESQAL